MDKCTKFKIFNLLLIFCLVNFLLYRFFSQPESRRMLSLDTDKSMGTVAGSRSRQWNSSQVQGNSTLEQTGASVNTELVGEGKQDSKVTDTAGRSHGGSGGSATIAGQNIAQAQPVTSEVNKTAPSPSATGVQQQMSSSLTSPAPGIDSLTLCPLVPQNLNGPLATYTEGSAWTEIAAANPGLLPGGRYKPPDCRARHRVAIIIPYRNREEHLKVLLKNLHPMLGRQQLDYGIFVIDQALPGKFNRAMLMNIGYAEAMKRYDYQCAVFHDVDLIPENDKNIYSCPEQPRHLSAAIDKFKYRLPYAAIYGGVSAVSREQFEKINGFSNMFFGWGGEDDDMAIRIKENGFKITRYPMEIARYKMIKHTKDTHNEQNPKRFALLKTTKLRMANDGLNSLKYTVQMVEELPTHLRIQVLIKESDITKH